MNVLYKLFCRAYQAVFRALIPVLPYRQPQRLDRVEQVPEVLKKLSLDRVLLVTDAGLCAAGLTAPLEAALAASGIACTVYADTRANPTVQNVEDAFALYREHRCNALIALGGGSSMDCAKAVGARAAFPRKTLGQMKGLLRVWKPLPTLIAIPTTAGTGSETTITAVITDSEQKHKYTMNNFTMIPRYAVLDARLTVSLPASLTATTGMDALTHAVEIYGHAVDRPLHDLAIAAGLATEQDADSVAAARFLEAVRQLNRRLGIPETLSGIRAEDIPRMARHAAREANPLYPVPVLLDAAQLEAFYTRVAGEQERAA